ncbi:MAG: hypothetical protein MUE52_16885 [Tabrizicola sp.]|nr:hypothetical protein [Tabrizicola sp.]
MSDGRAQDDHGPVLPATVPLPAEDQARVSRARTIDRKVIFGALRGVFDLNRAQIESFFHVIDQRISEQNHRTPIVCEVAVYYSDGTSRKFESVTSFSNYSETRNRFPTVVTIHQAYDLRFPDSSESERQSIDIEIRTSESISETIDMVANDRQLRMAGDNVQVMVGNRTGEYGVVTYTINHSRVSWGLDLEGHIKSQIEKILQEPTSVDLALRKVAGPLNLVTTVFVGLYLTNLIIDVFFIFLYQRDGATTEAETLKVAAEYLVNGQIAKFITASLVVAGLFFVFFSSFVSRMTRALVRPKPSFIVLDAGDELRRSERLKKHEKRWLKFAGLLLLDIGVATMLILAEGSILKIFQ